MHLRRSAAYGAAMLLLAACSSHDRDNAASGSTDGSTTAHPAGAVASSTQYRLEQAPTSLGGPRGASASSDQYLIVMGGQADATQ